MMLHRWNVRYSAKISAARVKTEKRITPGAMNRYADRSRHISRRSRRAVPSPVLRSPLTTCVAMPLPSPVARGVRPRWSAAGQDRLGLLRGVVEGLGRRLVAVHRLAELLVEDRLDPRELRVGHRAGDAALHQVDEALEHRL